MLRFARFLLAALEQLRARTSENASGSGIEFGMECALRPVTEPVLEAARALPDLAGAMSKPLFSLRCFKQTGAHIVEAAP